jgi:hypothetical protein
MRGSGADRSGHPPQASDAARNVRIRFFDQVDVDVGHIRVHGQQVVGEAAIWRIEDEMRWLGANYVPGGMWRGFAYAMETSSARLLRA